MSDPSDPFGFEKLRAANPSRRLRPKVAAEYLGVHPRTLEESRRSWRRAEKEGKPELRRGPKFLRLGKHVLYEVGALDEEKALTAPSLNGVSSEAAAKYIGVHPRTLENSRRSWRQAEVEGKPELRRGPRFHCRGNRVWYEVSDLDDYLTSTKAEGQAGS